MIITVLVRSTVILTSLYGALGQDKTLLVVAVPGGEDAEHYACQLGGNLNPLCRFIEQYAQAAADVGDDFLVVYAQDSRSCLDFAALDAAGALRIELPTAESLDIWIRDFGTAFPDAVDLNQQDVKFRYQPGYLPRWLARWTDYNFRQFYSKAVNQLPRRQRQQLLRSSLILDGGNIVNTNYKAVITRRVEADNKYWTAEQIENEIYDFAPSENPFKVCVIADPWKHFDTTGHSDGYVSFLDENTLMVADYFDGNHTRIVNTLRDCFPDINIVRLQSDEHLKPQAWRSPFPRLPNCRRSDFSSATGSTINLVSTKKGLYVPTFNSIDGIDNSDEVAVIRNMIGNRKTVVTVETGQLSHMGGNVRCLTWQVSSQSTVAQGLKLLAERQKK